MMNSGSSKSPGLLALLALTLTACIFMANLLSRTNDALLSAAESGDMKETARQLAYGADVNAGNRDGATALHLAALSGHLDVAELLIAHGANIDATEKKGGTPLYFAAIMGHIDVARMLAAYGAKTDKLGVAALAGNSDVARMLIAGSMELHAREKARIMKLKSAQAAREEQRFWQRAQTSEDAGIVQAYLDRFPAGSHDAAAREKLSAIAARQEARLWQLAQDGGNLQAVQSYLDKFPDGAHAAAAREKLAAIRSAGEPDAGKVIRDCPSCPEMVVIPAGSFEMGGAEAAHLVTLKSFALGKTEITQGQWKAVMGHNPSHFAACGDDCPVEQVSWNEVHEFARKLSASTGKQYRLPSEAEWEYACMAGEQYQYCGSDNLDSVAWHPGNSGNRTHPAAGKQANAFGLHDMNGNVWEWVEDTYHADFNGAPTDGSAWLNDGENRVLRGGSWIASPRVGRGTGRNWNKPGSSYYNLGFRLAMTLP